MQQQAGHVAGMAAERPTPTAARARWASGRRGDVRRLLPSGPAAALLRGAWPSHRRDVERVEWARWRSCHNGHNATSSHICHRRRTATRRATMSVYCPGDRACERGCRRASPSSPVRARASARRTARALADRRLAGAGRRPPCRPHRGPGRRDRRPGPSAGRRPTPTRSSLRGVRRGRRPAGRHGGRLLVNNAGGALGWAPVADADEQQWRAMYETNVLGVVRMIQALLPALEARGDGHRGHRRLDRRS